MELGNSEDARTATMESPKESIEELVTTKQITTRIAKNRAGRKAFMNNAPVDNFGTKQYLYVPQLTSTLTITSNERLRVIL